MQITSSARLAICFLPSVAMAITLTFASLYLLDAIDVLFVDRVIRSDHDRRNIRSDERDDAVLQLGAWMAFSKFVADLL